MKIAIIRKKYIFHGGAEGFSENLIEKLAEEGHEIHIFAIKWQTQKAYKNIHFHKVPAITLNSFFRDLTFTIFSFFLLRKQREYFDIIQSHDRTLYQDIYRAGDGCHIEWLRQRWKRRNTLGKLSIAFNPYHLLILSLERMLFNRHRFKKVIAISELVKKDIIDNYRLKEEDIVVIYNGVDLERFHPQNKKIYRKETRKRYSIDGDSFVVLFAGTGFERKGVEFLLKAVEFVSRPLTLLIVGRGSEKKLKDLIKRQRVIFSGPQKEIQKYYAASDIFVSPAIYEPFGNVHLEAMASGLPVITTGQSGASEIIEDGRHGFIIDAPEDVEGMARRISQLMDPEIREMMSLEARKLAEKFSFENHIKRMYKLYKDIKTGH